MTGLKRGVSKLCVLGALLGVILLIGGCQGFQGFGKQQGPQQLGAFVGGTQGLEIAFAEDQPPNAVLDNQQEEFFVTLLLKNLGEHAIPAGGLIASLSGAVQTTFGLSSLDVVNDFEIYGVAKEGEGVIPGGEEFLEFGTAMFKTDLPADTQFTLKADVCYNYQTQTVTTLCMKKDVLKKEVGQVCGINNPALRGENSGAPMHVTNMRQSTVGTSKIKFNFKVENKGMGAVYEPGIFSGKCVGQESNKGRVKVSVISPDGTFSSDCTQLGGGSSGVVKLINNQKDITCTIETGGLQEVTFQDLVIFKLDYVYREAVTVPLAVVNAA